MCDTIMLSKKLRLYPTKEQVNMFKKFCGVARFAYNECLSYRIDKYNLEGVSLTVQDCIEHIQDLKYSDDYSWIREVPEAVTKQAIKDLDKAYKSFFREKKGFPKYKKKGKCTESFYQRTDKFKQIDENHIKITGIKEPVKIKIFELPYKVFNPRISFDGKYWYLSFGYEEEVKENRGTEKIGIDLGIKNLGVVSDGRVYKNINKSKTVKRLEKHKRKLQRQLSRKYELNKRGTKFIKTNNILKLQHKVRLLDRRLANIRNTYIHEVTKDLVRTTPKEIVIEDLNVKGMMKNKHLSKAIQQQEFGKFRLYLEYKCKLNNIKLTVVDSFYPSSKTCSCCGNKKEKLSLSERIYVCDSCGHIIDRDLNAAINLSKYSA